MPLDSRYVLAPSLQMYFVNKDTGLPLVNGKVYFYKDNTSVPKDVFTIVAAGSDFLYTPLPNPSTLSAVGTFQNASGVDILPYYYPFDSNGNVELYRIEVYDSLGVLQFTRVGWPNTTSTEINNEIDVTNFVPNGQFLLHNDIPASTANGFVAGKVSSNTTIIAQGGWSYVRAVTGGVDFVTFPRYSSPVGLPTGNPRYAVEVKASEVGSVAATRRDLCLKFPDVNTFASDSAEYNFYFEAESNNGNDTIVQLILHKNFGTGGSPSADTFDTLTQFTLKNGAINPFKFPILFGTNTSSTLGTDESDYVEIILRFPLNATYDATLTDFSLTVQDVVLDEFQNQTEAQQIAPSTAGWLPEPSHSGFDLYLPPILTPAGMTFDRSQVGQVIADANLTKYSGNLSTITNSMLANGAQYRYNDYSALGIPFQRLGELYVAGGTAGIPQFGTGDDYATAFVETTSTQKLIFSLNKVGSQTAPSDGSVPTTFTFTKIIDQTSGPIPVAPGFNFVAYTNGSTLITAIGNVVGAALVAPSSGTSGMTVTSYRNIAGTYQAINITALSAAALAVAGANPAKYFQFSNTTTQYFMWFKTALETVPGGAGTGIEVDLDPAMTAIDVARVIANVMAGYQQYQITCTASSTFIAGAFWQFTANSQVYYPYYIKDGVDSPPTVTTQILIPINVATGDTNAQVASKTQVALNKFYFKVPDLRGLFLRGYDPTGEWDIDYLKRFSVSDTLLGSSPGSMELDQITNHTHLFSKAIKYHDGATTGTGDTVVYTADSTGGGTIITINETGQSESRPVNMAVVWAIKY